MKIPIGLAFGGLAFLTTQSVQADVNVGVSVALTGPGASLGIPVRNALSLWPREIAGEKIVLHVLDDGGDPTAASKNARRFAEDKVDVIVGSANTPSTIAIAQVASEARVLQLAPSPAELAEGRDAWTFRAAMPAGYYTEGLVEHMKRSGVRRLAFLGLSDAYGESYLQAFTRQVQEAGIKLVAVERFARADASVATQALKVVTSQPDAVVVVAIGGGAALPHKALSERVYTGKIYHTAASVSPDFLRLAGKDAEGALAISGPEQVPEQLPPAHPARQVASEFVERYEAKFGAGSRTQFAAHIYDFGLVLQTIVPAALKKAKPGTPEFRLALKDALENSSAVPVTKGLLKYTPTDHWGHGPDARVMLTLQAAQWKLVR
ncbi:MAG: ABC transporter substrate-binding protein [Burkholderiaceae bacterium]